MTAPARLGLVLVFCGLCVTSLLYTAAVSPAGNGGQAGPAESRPAVPRPAPAAFAWTAAERACAQDQGSCETGSLAAVAAAAPLSPLPFALQLTDHIVSGDEAGAVRTAAQVLARDPRSRDARQVLAAQALREEDFDRFMIFFLPLFNVDADQGAAYAEFLAGLSTAPQIRAAIVPELRDAAPWGAAYLGALTRQGGLSAGDLIALHRYVPSAQAPLLQRLTQSGQWDTAYAAFADFVLAGAGAEALDLSVPFNPELRITAAPAPFNWSAPSRRTKFLEEGGVYVFYEGRKTETFLVQSFALSPGAYQLTAEQRGEAAEAGGFFSWQISCAAGGPALARFDVLSLKAAPEAQAWDFDLAPASCPYLTLSLSGVPGSFPRPARIEVSSVRLRSRSPKVTSP